MTHELTDRVYGCLIGGAIGDALGATVEGWSYSQIKQEYGTVDDFGAYDNPHARGEPGSVTDDSVMRHYLCLSIVEHGGRVTPDEFAETLQRYLNVDRVWVTEEVMIRKLAAGMDPWESGRGNIPAGTAAMAIAPVGIVNASNPRQAYQDGYNLASINQDGIDRDTAATIAAGVAQALSKDTTVDEVIETMCTHSSQPVSRILDLTLGIADQSNDVHSFVEDFYAELLDWRWPAVDWSRESYYQGEVFSASSIESFPAAVGILSLCGDEPNTAIVEAANFGRDCDTIATIVGNVVGAVGGAERLRDSWKRQCRQANEDFFEEVHGNPDKGFESMAVELVDVLKHEREQAAQRLETLDDLLDS